MQTLRILVTCLILVVLISCNSRQNARSKIPVSSAIQEKDTLEQDPDQIDFGAYSQGFTERIIQQFSVSHQKRTVITGKKGLKVTVQPEDLETEDGSPVNNNINVQLIELRNSSDFLRANAATMSNGKLLASGGSYFIGMECGGKKLSLKQGKSLEVCFPRLVDTEMELFYGTRNAVSEMNWTKANIPLWPDVPPMNSFTGAAEEQEQALEEFIPGKVFSSLEAKTYYYDQPMTLRELVDTLNSKSQRVILQTISFWPKNLPKDRRLDTNYLILLYGPQKQYILRTWKSLAEEEKMCMERQRRRDTLVNSRINSASAKQLLQYYAPSSIRDLGWINCDRFFKGEQTEMEVELPITFNNRRLEYFVLFRSINGFVRKYTDIHETQHIRIGNLPVGESVSIIAFIKNNGLIYQAKKEVQVQRNGMLHLEFQPITEEDLAAIFNSNAKI